MIWFQLNTFNVNAVIEVLLVKFCSTSVDISESFRLSVSQRISHPLYVCIAAVSYSELQWLTAVVNMCNNRRSKFTAFLTVDGHCNMVVHCHMYMYTLVPLHMYSLDLASTYKCLCRFSALNSNWLPWLSWNCSDTRSITGGGSCQFISYMAGELRK